MTARARRLETHAPRSPRRASPRPRSGRARGSPAGASRDPRTAPRDPRASPPTRTPRARPPYRVPRRASGGAHPRADRAPRWERARSAETGASAPRRVRRGRRQRSRTTRDGAPADATLGRSSCLASHRAVPARCLLARPLQTEGRREELGNVNDYEIMLLLGPDLAEERQNEIVARTRELIEKAGGTWEGQDAWGRRKLAYEIARSEEAFYHVLYLSAPPETLD